MTEWPRRVDHPTASSYRRAMEAYREQQAMAAEDRRQPFGPAELKAKREQLALSQARLAELLQVSPSTIAHWEQGVQEFPSYLRLALERLETVG